MAKSDMDPEVVRANAEFLERTRRDYVRALIPDSPSYEESLLQLKALEPSLKIHSRRTVSYGTVWKRWGPLSPLLSAAKKMDRLMEVFWFNRTEHRIPGKPKLDDAYDLINYAVFFIRLFEEEN